MNWELEEMDLFEHVKARESSPLHSLFAGEEPICGMSHTRTIAVSTWQKTPKEMKLAFVESTHLAPHYKMLQEEGMNPYMPYGALVFVRPCDYDFASSLAMHEHMQSKNIVYDVQYEKHIFATIMSIRSKSRPKLKHLDLIEIPDSQGIDVGTVEDITEYDALHNGRCIRATSFRTTNSLSKYTEYLERCRQSDFYTNQHFVSMNPSDRPFFLEAWMTANWDFPPAHPFQ
tara:strand:- start:635 stop:1324 length:690 start_codon:yes stop_codon:yes gene_type:complete